MPLHEQQCEVCQTGAATVSDEELQTLIKELPDWQVVSEEGIKKLRRRYRFKNFKQALELGYRVGLLAEEYGHHPEITIEWGALTVTWWTHKIKGLHTSDFIMAAKTDRLQEP